MSQDYRDHDDAIADIDRRTDDDRNLIDKLRHEGLDCRDALDELQAAMSNHHDVWMGLSGELRGNGTYARFGEIEDEFRATATALTTCIEQEINDRDTEARRIRARDEGLEEQRHTLTARQTNTDTRGSPPWA